MQAQRPRPTKAPAAANLRVSASRVFLPAPQPKARVPRPIGPVPAIPKAKPQAVKPQRAEVRPAAKRPAEPPWKEKAEAQPSAPPSISQAAQLRRSGPASSMEPRSRPNKGGGKGPGGLYSDKAAEKKRAYEWSHEPQVKKVLPIQEKRDEVMPVLCGDSLVVCLVGETGSGKSTQVPQMILEEARQRGGFARIAVTQPRRVAALNLAHRVASELGEQLGDSVGYRIGGDSSRGKYIDFCTVGYILQLFLNAPEEFGEYTHIVLDEVHERSAESDMLCLVVRLLAKHRFEGTRLVIMSATLQSDLFAHYFGDICRYPVGRVHVGSRCFPVKEHYLDELSRSLGKRLRCEGIINSRAKDMFGDGREKKAKRIDQRHCDKLHPIILELLEVIAKPASTILVFLPGIAEISSLWQEAKFLEESNAFKIFPLHSMVPREEQELVFEEPDPDVTHVVLATDIAESSITLPHVVAVIDLGLHRRMDHDATKGIASLATKWISKAAATQRSGRAGRTQPGICLRLYPKQFHATAMPDFEPPESMSLSLDRLYLQAKQLSERLGRSLDGPGVPRQAAQLLAQMPEAPDLKNVELARERNAELGAISECSEDAYITALGRLCLQLPLDLKLSRLVWLGAHFGLMADAVVLASVLSSLDSFSMPSPLLMREEADFVERLRSAASARLLFDGGELSEPLMQRQLFLEWLAEFHKHHYVWGDKDKVLWARRRHTSNFSFHYSLSRGRMDHMVAHVVDLALRAYRATDPKSRAERSLSELLRGLGYVVNKKGDLAGIEWKDWKAFRHEEAFETDARFLKALLATAFSDNLFIGGYGSVPAQVEANTGKAAKKARKELEVWQKEMETNSCPPRESLVVLKGNVEDPDGYVEFVCGTRPKAAIPLEPKEATLVHMDGFKSEASRWAPLHSRAGAPLLVSQSRLPAEFNLLSQFEKHMQELQRARITAGWTYKPVAILHPHILKWEWMHPLYTNKGLPLRCEGLFEKKNPVGLVGYVQPLVQDTVTQVACFAVAASVRGGPGPTRSYPEGVTCLSAAHLGFILASTKLDSSKFGLRRFGFTMNGALAVLHRCLQLPDGSLHRSVWEKIHALRKALRWELEANWAQWEGAKVLYDSPVFILAWDLHQATLKNHGLDLKQQAKFEEEQDCAVERLKSTMTVDLLAVPARPEAFLPVAEWQELARRREAIVQRINTQVRQQQQPQPQPQQRPASGRREPDRAAQRKVRSRSRSRRQTQRKKSATRSKKKQRSLGRRSRSNRRDRKEPRRSRDKRPAPAHGDSEQSKLKKVREASLFDLVKQVLERWRNATDSDLADDAFETAVRAALAGHGWLPKELQQVSELFAGAQAAASKGRRRSDASRRGAKASAHVPAALSELMSRLGISWRPDAGAAAAPEAPKEPEVKALEPPPEPADEKPDEEADEEPDEETEAENKEAEEPERVEEMEEMEMEEREDAEKEGEEEMYLVDGAPGWFRCLDAEGNEYYYNEVTGETTWDMPDIEDS